jgi:protein TonB
MFANLIESRSHSSEFARRGYFLVGTILSYGLLIVAGAVGSVYAYDAHLESQNLELVALISPAAQVEPKPVQQRVRPQSAHNETSREPVRTQAVSRLSDSTKAPDTVSTDRSNVVEAPTVPFRIGPQNIDPGGPTGPIGDPGPEASQPRVIDEVGPPPVKHEVVPEVKKNIVISKGPVTGQAISLPKPAYPRLAMDAHVHGAVKVQVLIDETGKVVSTQVLDGPPLLRAVSEQAARQARFNPTRLGEVAVKVSGYIVYNFNQ